MQYGIDLIIVASGISLVGIALYFYFTRDPRIWWTIIGLVVTLWTRELASQASTILLLDPPISMSSLVPLLITVSLGIMTTVIAVVLIRKVSKRFQHHFNNTRRET
jgi:hypothetical protein